VGLVYYMLGGTWVCLLIGCISDVISDACEGKAWLHVISVIFYFIALVAFTAGYGGCCWLLMWLVAILLVVGAICMWLMEEKNDDALEGIDMDEHRTQSNTACPDVYNLLIVQIDSVSYPGDVEVSSSQSHPGTSTGLLPTRYRPVRSSAKADYGGGDVGSFTATYTCFGLTSAH